MATPTLTANVTTTPEWVSGPRDLSGTSFTLRELRPEDAPLLLESMTFDEMASFLRTTPVLGGDPSIWAHDYRETDTCVCFAVVPVGTDTAVGIVQLRCALNPTVMH